MKIKNIHRPSMHFVRETNQLFFPNTTNYLTNFEPVNLKKQTPQHAAEPTNKHPNTLPNPPTNTPTYNTNKHLNEQTKMEIKTKKTFDITPDFYNSQLSTSNRKGMTRFYLVFFLDLIGLFYSHIIISWLIYFPFNMILLV